MNGQDSEANSGMGVDHTEPPAQVESGSVFDADDLAVKLVFTAGEMEVPLRDLRRIVPGYVFELRQPADRHIEVRANGRIIGRGELVDIDGRAGVRLLDCESPPAS